ncbi:OmpA family protein [uncultured Fibrobacter sp.]|uniref:OmpA family protein n=1 Tax=uncultured Fibrobacter sp. TaxID=261512 RepID=UPI00263A395B|nr:OmpA family protein [uncultured Fibrobacter sp.]
MKKLFGIALLAAGCAFAQIGMEGGSDGLHQINAKTLGQWNFAVGTGGNIAIDGWSLARGGKYTQDGRDYSYNWWDYTQAGNFFVSAGLLDNLDVGVILPVYYEHANSNGPSGSTNQWTTSRGDLDLWTKIRIPLDTNKWYGFAVMLNMYIPTGESNAGVRPRHAWYLNGNGYTQPFTADDWAFSAGLVGTADLTKLSNPKPFRFNLAASYLYPLDLDETQTLVYSAGVNWLPKSWMDVFLEYSGEMRLQSKGEYKFEPFEDPMLITPGLRFHLPYNIDFAMGLEVAVRALKNITYDGDEEMKGCGNSMIHYEGEDGSKVDYCYAPTPLVAGAALLTWRFGADMFRDSDGDGVNNNKDKCAHTRKGIAVDENGCPLDSDKDGVVDSYDKCPNTPDSVKVNTDGCADKDSAFVTDANAARTASDSAFRADSLKAAERARQDSLDRVDTDKDGISDLKDKCPNTREGIVVDSVGCMLDFDKDGVADSQDKCPNTKSGISVDSTGCPMDFDKDGVPDDFDKCPNTKDGISVDSTGCPADSDNDGISDGQDKCPGTAAGMPVDSVGCVLDGDKDGVPDNLDKCPNTLEGIAVKEDGCPVNKKEDLDQLKKGIQFQTGSTKLTKKSYTTLNDIASLMRKVKSANLEVQGHTDNTGSEAANQALSEKRAQAVVDFLKKKGIEADRLRAIGFGSEMSIADNSTKEGREQNRRVELVPFEK